MSALELHCGDCLELMRAMPANSVDLIATDPPYYKVKGEAWDNQWTTPAAFLAWFDLLAEQWQRVLRPNGSLYVFAWPKMAARIEVLLDERFNVLTSIVWEKERDRGKHAQSCKKDLRMYFPNTERLIFAEHKGADNMAKGEAGYATKCDELRGFIFEPLRSWFRGRMAAGGVTAKDINRAVGSSTSGGGMASHFVGHTGQYEIPTAKSYALLRVAHPVFDREYEDLRTEYEDLRRPFSVTADVPYTDVWTFPTVSTRKGKHPCEKPAAMMEHIVSVSSRPGAVVLDPFMGSGATGLAAIKLGRRFIGMEMDPAYFKGASEKLTATVAA